MTAAPWGPVALACDALREPFSSGAASRVVVTLNALRVVDSAAFNLAWQVPLLCTKAAHREADPRVRSETWSSNTTLGG
jgi:hypothetical protein